MHLKEQRRQELEAKITDLETTLAQLKGQLRAETEAEQHAAIENLETYIGQIDNKNAHLQDFWKMLLDDFKTLFAGNDTGATK